MQRQRHTKEGKCESETAVDDLLSSIEWKSEYIKALPGLDGDAEFLLYPRCVQKIYKMVNITRVNLLSLAASIPYATELQAVVNGSVDHLSFISYSEFSMLGCLGREKKSG